MSQTNVLQHPGAVKTPPFLSSKRDRLLTAVDRLRQTRQLHPPGLTITVRRDDLDAVLDLLAQALPDGA